MSGSKFKHGDLVKIADDLGKHMAHFTSGVEAIVDASYRDKFGHGDSEIYTIFIKGCGEVSWYYGNQLTFIRNDLALLEEWEKEVAEDVKKKSDIKWIHANWMEVKKKAMSVTIISCMDLVGFRSSFHRNGEFFVLFDDWRMLLPFMDKLMTARTVEDMKGPDGEISELASELFHKLQNKIK